MTANSIDDLIAQTIATLEHVSARQAEPQGEIARSPASRADHPWVPSAALLAIAPHHRPAPATLCEGCPQSVWMVTPMEVRCYCRVMYTNVWSTREPSQITECDGIWIGQDA